MAVRRLTVLCLLGLLAAAVAAPAGHAARPALRAFEDCSSVIRYGNRHAPKLAPGPRPTPVRPMPVTTAPPGAGEDARPAPVAAPVAGEDFSTTTVQEAGVDEPDVVKTDGRTIFALADGRLRAIDVTGESPRVRGTLRLGSGHGHQMLLEGDRALVLWSGTVDAAAAQAPTIAPTPVAPYRSTTVLALVDVADPDRLRLLRTLTVDGDLLAARATGSTARVVLATTPRAIAEGVAASAARVSPKRANAWLPAGTFVNVRTRRVKRRAIVRCSAVRHPRAFSGLGTLTVLTIDPDKGLEPVDSDALMTSGDTVYASIRDLYVATQRYKRSLWTDTAGPVPERTTTQIHRFALSGAGTTTYRGSGEVPGFLLSQFSMSERRGVLRVASTSTPPWFADGPRGRSESFVTTLKVTDDGLPRFGQVGGLGAGERIYAVRFLDDAGYVVTFRQVDPLYTIDVGSPEAPKVLGELKILGYSAYLHPAGKGRLIGVGQDATDEGRLLGTQISLFDVSDLSAPALLQRATVGAGASSEVDYDHHAFLWWPARNLAVIPVSIYDVGPVPADGPSTGVGQGFLGAIGFTVGDAGIVEAGRVTHGEADHRSAINRSVVVGDRLYTLSSAGLKASRLHTLADIAFVAF